METRPQDCFPALGREELWKHHLWETLLAFHMITVWQKTPHLSKILKLVLDYRGPTEFVCTTDDLDSLLLWKAILINLSESPESTLNTGRTIKTSFILIRQSYILDYKMENMFTKEQHIKKIQMTDRIFRVLLFSTFY